MYRTIDRRVLGLLGPGLLFIAASPLLASPPEHKDRHFTVKNRPVVEKIVETFGWMIGDDQAKQMASSVDIRPERENPRAFVRRVTPGDYRGKLRPQTIEKINMMLRPAMELFGYTV
jgi:hypothetical protein